MVVLLFASVFRDFDKRPSFIFISVFIIYLLIYLLPFAITCLYRLKYRDLKIIDFFPVPSSIPSFSLPDVLCDPADLIGRKGTSFEAMTGHIAPSSDGRLAEVFRCFPQL
jgi:hypothetical protein